MIRVNIHNSGIIPVLNINGPRFGINITEKQYKDLLSYGIEVEKVKKEKEPAILNEPVEPKNLIKDLEPKKEIEVLAEEKTKPTKEENPKVEEKDEKENEDSGSHKKQPKSIPIPGLKKKK